MKNTNIPYLKQLLLISGIIFITCKTGFSQAQSWLTNGDSVGGSAFLGTTNNEPLLFEVNSHQAMVILANGDIGIGTSDPHYALQIVGDVVDSGNFFATNIATSNSISVGQFKIVDGVVDSIVSSSGTLQLSAATVNADGAFNAAQTLTAGTSDTAITINGTTGTITSPLQTISFGNDTIATTGAMKMGNLNATGNSVAMPGIVNDTNTDVMGIDRHGHIIPLSGATLAATIYPIGPAHFSGPCSSNQNVQSTWYYTYSSSYGGFNTIWSTPCTLVGVGTNTPDAALTISNGNEANQFSVENSSLTDVFTIDQSGNTIQNGSASINGSASVGNGLTVNSSLGAGLTASFINNNSDVFITTNMATYDWNNLTIIHDNGIFWTDNVGGGNSTSGFVIAPWAHSNAGIRIDASGRVAIGGGNNFTTPGSYGLYVENGILTSLVKIALPSGANWSDYVFGNNYKLKPLTEVAKYIKENKHLPDIPSAADVQKNGINVAEMDATLLKKVEELTLYILQQNKSIENQQAKIDELEKKVAALSNGHK